MMRKIFVTCVFVICVQVMAFAGARSLQIDMSHVSNWVEKTVEYFDPNEPLRDQAQDGRFGCLPIGSMEVECWTVRGSWDDVVDELCQQTENGVSMIEMPRWLGPPYSRVVVPTKKSCLDVTEPAGVLFKLGENGAENLQVVAESVDDREVSIVLWWNDADVGNDSLGWVIGPFDGSDPHILGVGLGSSFPLRWLEVRGSVGQIKVQMWALND